jgi:hypothetical protein
MIRASARIDSKRSGFCERILLSAHSHDGLAEVSSLEHADEGFGRLLQTVDDIFAISNSAFSDAGADFAQEFVIVMWCKSFPRSNVASVTRFFDSLDAAGCADSWLNGSSIVIVAILWPYGPIRDEYCHEIEYCGQQQPANLAVHGNCFCSRQRATIFDFPCGQCAPLPEPIWKMAQATSNSPAAPMPPPTHMVTTTYLTLRRLPSINACPTMREPLIP